MTGERETHTGQLHTPVAPSFHCSYQLLLCEETGNCLIEEGVWCFCLTVVCVCFVLEIKPGTPYPTSHTHKRSASSASPRPVVSVGPVSNYSVFLALHSTTFIQRMFSHTHLATAPSHLHRPTDARVSISKQPHPCPREFSSFLVFLEKVQNPQPGSKALHDPFSVSSPPLSPHSCLHFRSCLTPK